MKHILSVIIRVLSILLFFVLWFYPAAKVLELKLVNWHEEYRQYTQKSLAFNHYPLIPQFQDSTNTLASYVTAKTKNKTISITEEEWQSLIKQVHEAQKTSSYIPPGPLPAAWSIKPESYLVQTSGNAATMVRIRPYKAYDYGWSSAPAAIRYPLRTYWWQIMLVSLCLFLLASAMNRDARSVIQKSTAFTGFGWGIGISLIGITGIAVPFLYDMPGMRGGFALFSICGFVAIGGIITMSVFGFQLRALKRMLSGIDILAHWTYSPAEWQAFTELEFKEMKGENLQKWLLVSAISLIIGIAFMLIMRDKASVQVFVFLMGFLVFLAFVAWIVPQLGYRRNRREPGEVFIAETGACINGAVHTWNLLDATLDSVELTHDNRLLVFIYSYLTRYGRESVPLRVPVPSGRESKALDIVSHFHGRQ